jgi:hypothetical protein
MTDSRISIVVTDLGAGVRSAGNVKSNTGEVFLSSEGEIQITGGKITSATTATLNSEKDLSVTDAEIEGQGFVSLNSNNGDVNLGSSAAKTTITADDVVIRSATGSVTNNGATVASANDIEVEAHDSIINLTLSAAYRAIFDAGVDLTLTAANGDITNTAGRFIANDDLNISAVNGDVSNLLERETIADAGVIKNYSRSGGRSLFRKRTIHGYKVDYGDALLPGEQAVFVANDHVNIVAKNLNNTGGEIYSNEGDVDFTIGTAGNNFTGTVTIGALQAGSAWFETGCAWFCNRSGASSVELLGGFVQAGNDLNIKANYVTNSGGYVTAMNDMTITGLAGGKVELVQAKALDMFSYSSFARGIRGDYGNLQRFDQGGSFVANQGRLQIDSLRPVELEGGEIGGNETVIENGTVTIRPKLNQTNVTGLSIGFLGVIF